MKLKSFFKKSLYIVGILLFFGILILSFSYYYFFGKYEENKNEYPNYIGFIDQRKALLNSQYELCDKENIRLTHHGAADLAFKGSKIQFKDSIISKFNHQLYKDSGYISYRFLVNCKGEAGWFEIIEMNLDLVETDLNNNMVSELLNLTSNNNNWNKLGYSNKEKFDYYMYVLYRIENGKIIEILP